MASRRDGAARGRQHAWAAMLSLFSLLSLTVVSVVVATPAAASGSDPACPVHYSRNTLADFDAALAAPPADAAWPAK